jgi:hypothetical protein
VWVETAELLPNGPGDARLRVGIILRNTRIDHKYREGTIYVTSVWLMVVRRRRHVDHVQSTSSSVLLCTMSVIRVVT